MPDDPRLLDVSVDIAAPLADVWTLLVTPASYPDWSPFVVAVDPGPDGVFQVGVVARLRVRLWMPRPLAITSPERIIALDPRRRLGWSFAGLPGWLLGAARYQDLETLPSGATRYHTHQRYSGLLAPLVLLLLRRRIVAGFEATAAALKTTAEAGRPTTRNP